MMIQLLDGFTYNTTDILQVAQYSSLPFEARSIELKKVSQNSLTIPWTQIGG